MPAELHVDVECSSDVAAVVSWNATHGAANFSLTAIISGTLQTLCTTQRSTCNVTGLSCGETYNLSLTAANDQCSLAAPTHTNLTARECLGADALEVPPPPEGDLTLISFSGPCPPERVAANMQCGSGTAVVSWEERSDVELYRARAVTASGNQVHNCSSVGSTCQLSALDCGEMYNVTVTAYSQGCSSQASSTVFIHTGTLHSPSSSCPSLI